MHKSLGQPGRGYELITANYFANVRRSHEIVKLSHSSFSEARDKLSWEAFAYLLDRTLIERRSLAEPERWHGHRVRAVDGSFIQLTRSAEILKTFPVRLNTFGITHYPQASLVVAADIYTCQPTHTFIGNKHLSERETLRELTINFEKGDISVLDRNFTGKETWKHFDDCGQHYVGRLRTNGGGVIKFNHRLKDQVIELEIKGGAKIKVRVIRGPKFKNGDYLYLITNLLDHKKYTRSEILGLYKMRQSVEDVFLQIKHSLHATNIRSRKVNGVLQEIYATLTMASIVAGLRYLYQKVKTKWKVSFKALAWRIETAFEVLVQPVSKTTLRSIFRGINKFGHRFQPGRTNPRYSRQPENKWIKERRRKNA